MADSQQQPPDLSILMPVYNEAGTVDRAIAQVLEADLGVSIELIVVDDGSTDGSSARKVRAVGWARWRNEVCTRREAKRPSVPSSS